MDTLGSDARRAGFNLLPHLAPHDGAFGTGSFVAMTTTRDHLAQVPISVDGKHIGLYALATAVAGKPPNEGNY